ncbi:MAG: hypothetical protein HYV41_05375 [Candidatus Magasanikbacteria bacterium]|nr:hypothetical protein [Candidatus Magasanikbacteria bacterium]
MGDKFLRHLITTIAILILALVYWAGYVAGSLGWWPLFLGVCVLYPLVFKLVDV